MQVACRVVEDSLVSYKSTCQLDDVASALLPYLCSQSRAALAHCSRQLRQSVHHAAEVVIADSTHDLALICKRSWPNLVLIVLRTRCEQSLIQAIFSDSSIQLLATAQWRSTQSVKHTGLIVRPNYRQHVCCGPDIGAAFAYLRSLEWHQSTHLVITYSQLHPGLVVQQLTQSSWPSLTALCVTQVNLDLVLLRQLADGSWPRLVQLAIGGVPATNLGGMLGVATSAWPHLSTLAMRGFTASPFNLTNLPLRHLSRLKLH